MNIIILLGLVTQFYAVQSQEIDQGTLRLRELRTKSLNTTSRLINFTSADYHKYVMQYPRPYDIVIFFTADGFQLCDELFPEFQYLIKLYDMDGAIDALKSPTFFAVLKFQRRDAKILSIFQSFEFESVPNLVVSKPHMAVVSEMERRQYYQSFSWEITQTDNSVTTHKMLEFVNKRTLRQVEYRHTDQVIQYYVLVFVGVAVVGAIVYFCLQRLWNHWIFWLIASLTIYVTCVSGIVYCHIHNVPFNSRDQSGLPIIFGSGSREQTELEGWVLSGIITTVGLLFILIGVTGQKCSQKFSAVFGIIALLIIYIGVNYLEQVYRKKGLYDPIFYPPNGYLKGPLNIDQGNNI